MHPSKISPTSRTSPELRRPVSSEVPLDDTRSGSSSPASRSLTFPELQCASLKMQTAPTDKDDKNSIYWQRRIRNNLAAKRSRDLRREREDKIAASCLRMDDTRQRLLYIRSEYIKLQYYLNLLAYNNHESTWTFLQGPNFDYLWNDPVIGDGTTSPAKELL